MLFPHSVESEGSSARRGSMTFEKIEVNIDLPDARFAMPKIKQAETSEADTGGSKAKPKENKPAGDKN